MTSGDAGTRIPTPQDAAGLANSRDVAGLPGVRLMTSVDVEGFAEVRLACAADATSRESVIARLGLGDTPVRRLRHLVVRDEGRVVAAGEVILRDADNTHLAIASVEVLPSFRRRGHGTAVLRGLMALAAGRSTLMIESVDEDGVGPAWADALGLRVAQRTVRQVRDMSAPVAGVPVPDGYTLAAWTRCPAEFVESYARARTAIADVPLGDLAITMPDWNPERVREHEDAAVARGRLAHVVAVIAPDGEVAGMTELEVDPRAPEQAVQQDTAVLSAHRGRGLGVVIKAANLGWLAANHPGARSVRTTTAADNVGMRLVNERVGFEVTRRLQNRQMAL